MLSTALTLAVSLVVLLAATATSSTLTHSGAIPDQLVASDCYITMSDHHKLRAIDAIVGAFVADAASMPLHWIYDVNKIKATVGDGPVAFHTPVAAPFYQHPFGGFSPYGNQASVLLEEIANTGVVEPVGLMTAFNNAFKQGGRFQKDASSYHDGTTRGFLANVAKGDVWPACGASDSQANAIATIVPAVALLAGTPNFLKSIETHIRVTQNTDQAVAFGCAAARILQKAILNGTAGLEAVQQVIVELEDPNREHPLALDEQLAQGLKKSLSLLDKSHLEACQILGQSCSFPNNLLTGAHLIAQQKSYEDSVNESILAGGDQCSRLMFVGAYNAAAGRITNVPGEWRAKTTAYPQILALAQKLASARA